MIASIERYGDEVQSEQLPGQSARGARQKAASRRFERRTGKFRVGGNPFRVLDLEITGNPIRFGHETGSVVWIAASYYQRLVATERSWLAESLGKR
jgi:hypothetical protein